MLLAAALALTLVTGCARQDRQITTAEGEMRVVVDNNNQFAIDLHRVAASDGGNVFVSPFSITAALSMVYAGAEGDTETQIADAMYVADEAAWHANLGALFDDLSGEKYRAYTLYSGNAVWGQQGEPFDGDYLSLLERDYRAPMESVDFAASPESARGRINRWVEERTQGHVEELFAEGDINDITKLVISNAIYFQADWLDAFEAAETAPDEFRLDAEQSVTAELMNRTADFRYASFDEHRILELPYQDDELSMVIVLPDAVDGLASLEAEMTAEDLAGWIEELRTEETVVALPKFEMKLDLPLQQTLEELGITDAFDEAAADFTGVIAREDMGGNWYIGAARHQAYVKVDESGTEAAAATGFAMEGDDDDAGGPSYFIADHPFLFLIRDQLTGAILFMGRVANPTA